MSAVLGHLEELDIPSGEGMKGIVRRVDVEQSLDGLSQATLTVEVSGKPDLSCLAGDIYISKSGQQQPAEKVEQQQPAEKVEEAVSRFFDAECLAFCGMGITVLSIGWTAWQFFIK